MALEIKSFSGNDARHFFDDLARLRIEVFRAFPYLYDGDPDYERRYLATYARSPGAVFVIATDEGRVVGASTAMPMAGETEEVKAPFIATRRDPADYLYFGESVLQPAYRGRGIGVAFFEAREAHAKQLGLAHCTFCAVHRPGDHPRRPDDYVPLDRFWQNRGYVAHPELATTFTWRDLDDRTESPKPLTFWIKTL